MGGLSTTQYDAASIELIGTHSVAALSGDNPSGRALSDRSHGSSSGLRYVEAEIVQRRSGTPWHWGIGFVDTTAHLSDWIGKQEHPGVYQANPGTTDHGLIANAAYVSTNIAGAVGWIWPGSRIGLWLNTATRKVWVATHAEGRWLPELRFGRPDLGTDEYWTVPGTGPIRFAITPGFGSGSNRNVIRVHTRPGEFLAIDTYGATAWDSRTITLTGTLDASDVSVGDTLRWAWFDHESPHLITSAPTSVGSTTVLTGPAYSIAASTSLDSAGAGMLVLMKSDGTPIACRGHVAPVTVP